MHGKYFTTLQNYYQYMKFAQTDPAYAEEIRAARPTEAMYLGNVKRTPSIRADWDNVKRLILKEGLRKRVDTNEAIKKLLLSTGDSEIEYVCPEHRLWGTGSDGRGENLLGKLLQEVRADLVAESKIKRKPGRPKKNAG
jgi:ribA/ribD-fused uncharacterized protein